MLQQSHFLLPPFAWSRLSNSSPRFLLLCCTFVALGLLPSLLSTTVVCSPICTTNEAQQQEIVAEDLEVQHLLQRSTRDTNDDDNVDNNSNEADLGIDQQQQQQMRQMDGGSLSIGTFLGNLSITARRQLYDIVNSVNMTKKQMNDALDTWAQQQGQSFYTVYLGLKAAYEAARQQLDRQHSALMQNQSQAVREADAKMQTISNNQFITIEDEKKQMVEQMAKFSADVQQTLFSLAPYPNSKK